MNLDDFCYAELKEVTHDVKIYRWKNNFTQGKLVFHDTTIEDPQTTNEIINEFKKMLKSNFFQIKHKDSIWMFDRRFIALPLIQNNKVVLPTTVGINRNDLVFECDNKLAASKLYTSIKESFNKLNL